MLLQRRPRKGFWQILMQNPFLSQYRNEPSVPTWETILLKLSSPCIWDSLSISRKRLCCIVAKWFLSLFVLLQSYKNVGEEEVKTFKNYDCCKKKKPSFLQIAHCTCVHLTPSTRPLFQALRTNCKRLRNMGIINNNKRGSFLRRNWWFIMCEFWSQINVEKGALTKFCRTAF